MHHLKMMYTILNPCLTISDFEFIDYAPPPVSEKKKVKAVYCTLCKEAYKEVLAYKRKEDETQSY